MINKYKILRQSLAIFIVSYITIFLFSLFLYSGSLIPLLTYELVLKSIITSLIFWYFLYFASIHKYVFYFATILLALLLTIKIYYSFILGVHIEPSVFEGMFDTNIDELKRLGSNKPFYIFFSLILFLAIVSEFRWFKSFPFKHRVLLHFSKFMIVIFLFMGYGIYKHKPDIETVSTHLKQTFPINFINSFYKAGHAKYKLYIMNKNKIDIAHKYDFKLKTDENTTIIFIRAEALRSRSFPIDDRNTSQSVRLNDVNNTVYYKNVFSYANYTQAAVPWMLTRSINDKLQNEKSLISILSTLGYTTTWVGCDHSNLANFATPIVNYSLEANNSLFLGKIDTFIKSHNNIVKTIIGSTENGYDGKQFAYTITQLQNSKIGKKFFWIEMNGSHIPWFSVVPRTFLYYKPYCNKKLDEVHSCPQKDVDNIYKNTILYTQYLVKKLISTVKDRNAIILFASDHGESTGENGYYGHGFMLPEDKRKIRDQINPAFMVWMSDKFRTTHKRKFEALQKNATKYMKHDIIFHSVLDIAGVQSTIIGKEKSIFSNSFTEREKPLKYRVENENSTVDSSKDNSIIFTMDKKNPNPFYKSSISLLFSQKYTKISLGIADFYPSSEYPNRILLKMEYHNKVIYSRDISDKKGVEKDHITINFIGNDRNITATLEVQDGIEKDWGWGDAAKIKIDIKNKDNK